MGDAVDKHCLQDPLDVVEGVAHAGQAAKSCTCIYSTCSSDHGDRLALFCIIQERSYKVFVKRSISADRGTVPLNAATV